MDGSLKEEDLHEAFEAKGVENDPEDYKNEVEYHG